MSNRTLCYCENSECSHEAGACTRAAVRTVIVFGLKLFACAQCADAALAAEDRAALMQHLHQKTTARTDEGDA